MEAKLTRRAAEYEGSALSMVEAAEALTINTHSDYAEAQHVIGNIRASAMAVKELFAEPKADAWRTHKSITAAEKRVLGPLDEADKILTVKTRGYLRAVDEARRAAEREKYRAEQEAIEAARAVAEAKQRERVDEALDRDDIDAAISIEQTPILVSVPTVDVEVPEMPESDSTQHVETWTFELEDKWALIRAVMEKKAPEDLVLVNEKRLRALAKATRGAMPIPGVRWKKDYIIRRSQPAN